MAQSKAKAWETQQLHAHITSRWGKDNAAAKFGHAYVASKSAKPEKYGLKGLTGRMTAYDVKSGVKRRKFVGGSLDEINPYMKRMNF